MSELEHIRQYSKDTKHNIDKIVERIEKLEARNEVPERIEFLRSKLARMRRNLIELKERESTYEEQGE